MLSVATSCKDDRFGCERYRVGGGELLAVVTNGHRVVVMLLREPGDAGEHAIDASAAGATDTGYVLENGQVDTYVDGDTVAFDDAMDRVACVLLERDRPASQWKVDR